MLREHNSFYVGGAWVEPVTTATISVVSPSTEQVIGRVPAAAPADVDGAVAAARQAFDAGPWPRMEPAERAEYMDRLAAQLQARSQEIANLITDEVGTPITLSSMAQSAAGLMVLGYYAKLARKHAFEEIRTGMIGSTLVVHEPVGVAAAVVPWNYPFYLTMCKVAPALASGCTVIVKPAPETPLDAYILAQAAAEASLPPGVLNIVPADREVAEHLIAHPGVDKVSFTGSTAAGRRIMARCAESIRRVTLELGGKSACVLLDDADLDAALPQAVMSATANSGQTCLAQTRLLVPRSRRDEVVDRVRDAFGRLRVGDPHDPATQQGPLVSERQRARVEGYIESGQAEGAKMVCGGGRPEHLEKGYYVEPTVFVDVDNRMRVAQEEIFGPVLAVITYENEAEALAIANDSIYGLAGAVWTADDDRGVNFARRVRAGALSVNGLSMSFNAPFGGFKQSGIGRELGPEGLVTYLEPKSIGLPAGYQAHVAARR